MNRITEHIIRTAYSYENVWDRAEDKKDHLKGLTSVIFKEVFDICWKYCDNDTLSLIMEDIDKIKNENNLPI
jgi:hypothetical protein